MQNGNLPKDFWTFDQAIEKINNFNRYEPEFDMDFLVQNFAYIAPAHTFNFPLVSKDAKTGKYKRDGRHKYVLLNNEYEATTFEHAISARYREIIGKDLETDPVHNYTSTVTDTENGGNATGVLRRNTDASTATKKGAPMGGGN